jgi:recombination protein RecA
LKATNLVVQAGGFGIVAFDLADVPAVMIRQFPYTTWMRLSRVIEGSQTALVLIGAERIARSSGGATIALSQTAARWAGDDDRARHLTGLDVHPRVVTLR